MLKLSDLKVQSFVTQLNDSNEGNRLWGGNTEQNMCTGTDTYTKDTHCNSAPGSTNCPPAMSYNCTYGVNRCTDEGINCTLYYCEQSATPPCY
ncbi:pinensin family lanthipeptide [Spirosoma linguale]|uniref:pinensin family lanthipeptide n=1 Tax=Spirosoma linguale TaxID=108 RepID=UPI003CC7C851